MKSLTATASAFLLLAGAASAAPGDDLYARPGRLVAASGTRLNLYCTGNGSPAVVFDSGWEDWAPVWAIVQPQVAKWTRACSYDRAGAGFSDAGPMPRTCIRIADELHAALGNAGIEGPYVLVGHAFGGDNVRTFAARYAAETAGLVLVEADVGGPQEHRGDPERIADELHAALRHAGIKGPYVLVGHAFGGDNVRTFAARYTAETAGLVLVEADVGGPQEHRGDPERIAELRDCRNAVAAGKPRPPLPARPGGPPHSCAQQFFRGLPETMWSPELNAKLLELAQTKVAMYDAFISEMEQMSADEEYLQQHSPSLGSRPVRVLSTGNHGVHSLAPGRTMTAEQQQYQNHVASSQAKWLELSSNARQLFTDKSSEYLPFDQPEFVIDAIREVYSQSR